MNMIELDRLQIDWSQASPKFIEAALAEYQTRLEQRDEILAEFPDEDYERMYYGVPVSMPRRKHAYKLALEARK